MLLNLCGARGRYFTRNVVTAFEAVLLDLLGQFLDVPRAPRPRHRDRHGTADGRARASRAKRDSRTQAAGASIRKLAG
jgi:hypothetical protein